MSEHPTDGQAGPDLNLPPQGGGNSADSEGVPSTEGLEPTSSTRAPGRHRRPTRKRTLAAATIAALVAGTLTLLATTTLTSDRAPAAGPPTPVNAADGTITVGQSSATLLVDVYAEPACADCEDAIYELSGPMQRARSAGVARIRYHLTGTSSPAAVAAVNAATCASDVNPNSAVDLLEALLTNVFPDAANNGYTEVAHLYDVATPATLDCIKTGRYQPFLSQQQKNVPTQMPAFAINGKPATSQQVIDTLTAATAPTDSATPPLADPAHADPTLAEPSELNRDKAHPPTTGAEPGVAPTP